MGKSKFIVAMVVAFFVSSSSLWADDAAEPTAEAQGITALAEANESADPAAAIYWHFITCVHTSHECLHEAEHHGYKHYKAAHDHSQCGHHDLACYGGHH